MYEKLWREVISKEFRSEPLPTPEEVEEVLSDAGQIFNLLYRMIFWRHQIKDVASDAHPPAMTEYADIWDTYRDFFDMVTEAAAGNNPRFAELNLPMVWLCDMMDDYVWHFEAFHKRRNARALQLLSGDAEGSEGRDSDEESDLEDEELGDVWRTNEVLASLHSLVELSGVNQKLAESTEDKTYVPRAIVEVVGLLAITTAVRLHAKLGDYGSSLEVAASLQLDTLDAMFSRSQKTQMTLYYYLTFCMVMARRYTDAAAVASRVLSALQRSLAVFNENSPVAHTFLHKQATRLLSLMAVPLATCPALPGVDAGIITEARKMHRDLFSTVADVCRDREAAEEALVTLFDAIKPGFVAPSYSMDTPGDPAKVTELQRMLFVREALARAEALPTLRSYLQLYTSVDVHKVAEHLETSVETVQAQLLSLKLKMWQPVSWGVDAVAADMGLPSSSEAADSSFVVPPAAPVLTHSHSTVHHAGADNVRFVGADALHYWLDGNHVVIEARRSGGRASAFFANSIRELQHVFARTSGQLTSSAAAAMEKYQESQAAQGRTAQAPGTTAAAAATTSAPAPAPAPAPAAKSAWPGLGARK